MTLKIKLIKINKRHKYIRKLDIIKCCNTCRYYGYVPLLKSKICLFKKEPTNVYELCAYYKTKNFKKI